MAVKSRINVPISGTMTPLHPETEIDQVLGLARRNSTAYSYGAVVFAGSLPLGMVLKCTTAGTTASTEPSFSDATVGGTVQDGTVTWTYQPRGTLSREITPAFNHRDVITTSGTYAAPVTGWYRIVVKGGGGGGGGCGIVTANSTVAYSGGGEGGTTIGYEHLDNGDAVTIVIGAGGTGGSSSTTGLPSSGTVGGNTTATANGNTYTGGGGSGGSAAIGLGGTGTYPGRNSQTRNIQTASYGVASNNGVTGAGNSYRSRYGSGGDSGTINTDGTTKTGGNGIAGVVYMEYFDPTI